MEDIKAFGRNIRIYRKNLHMSQEVLAEKLDINTSNITKIENGEQFVSADVLYKLADILQVCVSDLFRTDEPQETSRQDSYKEKLQKYISTLSDEEVRYMFENIKLFQKYSKKINDLL